MVSPFLARGVMLGYWIKTGPAKTGWSKNLVNHELRLAIDGAKRAN